MDNVAGPEWVQPDTWSPDGAPLKPREIRRQRLLTR